MVLDAECGYSLHSVVGSVAIALIASDLDGRGVPSKVAQAVDIKLIEINLRVYCAITDCSLSDCCGVIYGVQSVSSCYGGTSERNVQ